MTCFVCSFFLPDMRSYADILFLFWVECGGWRKIWMMLLDAKREYCGQEESKTIYLRNGQLPLWWPYLPHQVLYNIKVEIVAVADRFCVYVPLTTGSVNRLDWAVVINRSRSCRDSSSGNSSSSSSSGRAESLTTLVVADHVCWNRMRWKMKSCA